jgi:rSAM/selenodomain-associated transferase 2
MMKPLVSIIIPTLNEVHAICPTLAAIATNETAHEVVVVDSGSSDGTADLAEQTGARLVRAKERNRAIQMNEGRRLAKGEFLLFLHADTLIAPVALASITNALRDRQVAGGAFARRYTSRSLFLRTTCLLAELRGKAFGWFLGDQAVFVRAKVFDALGGYRELEVFEDLDFSQRMKRAGRVVILQPPVMSSARRFSSRGPLLVTLSDLWLTCRYVLGKPSIARRLRNCSPAGCILREASPVSR